MPLRNTVTIIIAAIVSLVCYEKAWRNRYVSTIALAMDVIEDNYLEEVGVRELFENAMRGMLTGLDEYSDYIGPEDYEKFQQSIDQEFVGIGVLVEGPPEADELRVVTPLHGSPAHKAGLRAGDVIVEIDGQSTAGMLLTQAVKKMKGPLRSTVGLVIQRAGAEKTITLEIVRDVVQTKSVLGHTLREDGQWNYFLPANPRIGYVRMTTFGEASAEELRAVLPLAAHPVDALILDLRGNEGGLLRAAVETCDMFIEEGVIVRTRSRQGWEEEYFASASATIFDRSKPLAVLVDRYSASASEIVAACLADHGRAVVVGERTWGKGTVQNVIPLERGSSALKLTTASYWRPSNRNIHRRRGATEEDDWGVRPTAGLEVKLTDEQYRQLCEEQRDGSILPSVDAGGTDAAEPRAPFEDLQLQKAVEHLQRTLAPAAS